MENLSLNDKKIDTYECNLCTENVIDNYRVICPFCNVEICESCFQYGLLMELKDPACIYCKNKLSLEFVLSNNDTKWCKDKFIPFYENLNLEKEKTYIGDSIHEYKKFVEIRNLKKEINNIPSYTTIINRLVKDFRSNKFSNLKPKEIKELEEFKNSLNLILDEKDTNLEILNNKLNLMENKKDENTEKEVYICNCPNTKCKGFVTNNYFCALCNLEICESCMVEKKENHICNRNDVKSALIVKESSKPCPKCYVPIFKSSGCNQMFCTNCNVVFDWVSLKIDNGQVHNAHYFEWMTSQNNQRNINIEEVACGDIEEIYRNVIYRVKKLFNYDYDFKLSLNSIFQLNRVVNGEIIDLINEKLIKNNFSKYRINYLDNTLSENKWKKLIVKDTINNEKYRSIIEILQMFVTVSSDLIRQYAFSKVSINEFNENWRSFRKYFNKSLDEILQIFGGKIDNARVFDIIYRIK